MKPKLIPVIFTAAITSLVTFFIASHYLRQDITIAAAERQLPVNYTGFTGENNNSTGHVDFVNAAESSVKAVVHVKSTTKARVVQGNNVGDVFSQLFGPRQYYIPSQVESGSGVVISPDGYVVTNNHVIADADEVNITFNDKYTTKAKVVSADPSTDIALLKVEGATNMPFMEFGNSDNVRLGQWVLAVGYPLSLDATVTAGIVSAKGRSIGINKTRSSSAIESFIQTDAAVNPGNSGGALVNTAGQLIGINSAIASPTGSYAGYSYAIPSNIVRKVVNDMMKYGSVQRAYMGVQYVDSKAATPEQVSAWGLDKHDGVFVLSVLPNSGAAAAGIQKGDLITHINGQPVNSTPELQEQIARYTPGDNISVTCFRSGKSTTVTVKLTNLDGTTDVLKGDHSLKSMGATFRQVNDKEKKSYNIDGGVVVTEPGNGELTRQTQIKKGFVILGINDEPVHTVNDLQQLIARNRDMKLQGFYPDQTGMYYYGLKNTGSEGQ